MRATLASQAAALGVPSEVQDIIGDWRSRVGTSAGYVRNRQVVLGRVQRMVARFGQAVRQNKGVPDLLGE